MMQPWRRPARLDKDPVALPPRAPVPEIERIAQLLARSKNPVITTEAGGRSPESHAALHALAETLAIPVIETASSLFSNFPKDHPLHQGSNFEPFLETTDLALVVRSRIPWYPPSQRPPNGQVVLIDENPYRHHMVYQSLHADAVLEGDVAFTLETLRAAAQAAGLDAATIAGRRARHAAAHAKLDEARHATLGKAKSRRPIAPEWLCAALSEALPADTVYVDETVSNRGAVETHLRNQGQGSFLQVRGALGQCLGHALGAKLALRGRTVAALVGDGSFLYNPVTQSLGYAAQASLPILIVVFNNNEYRAMRETHLDYYPEGVAKKHNLFYGGPLGGPDYAALGAPFGAWGRKVEDPAALVPAIREALAATLEGRTAILNVVLEK
jgi:acetolactate synthase-1/2/3 large subunit